MPLTFRRFGFRQDAAGGVGGSSGSTGAIPITGVSGTLSDGNTITLTGSSMHNRQTAALSTHFQDGTRWSFEGTSVESMYTLNQNSTLSTSVALFGSQSLYCAASKAAGGSCPTDNIGAYANQTGGVYNATGISYARAYGRWNDNGTWPGYWKFLQYHNAVLLFQPANAGPNPPSAWILDSPGGQPTPIFSGSNPQGQLETNRWYCCEVKVDFTNLPVMTASAWVDGKEIISSVTWSSGGTANGIWLFGMINACSTLALNLEHWVDGMALSTSRIYPACLIELADSSDYDAANRVVQAPVFISDSQVQFVYNSTGVTSSGSTAGLTGSERWVFLTNNAQERSSGHQVA